jgi:hypothetical protein
MYRPLPSLLTRLRRHRGLWVLAVAVMLIKLTAGTICLTDGAEKRLGTATTTISAVASVDTVKASGDDAAGCVLGEVGGCHCTCAHTVTLPSAAVLSVAKVEARFHSRVNSSGYTPAMTGSLIRPPIA